MSFYIRNFANSTSKGINNGKKCSACRSQVKVDAEEEIVFERIKDTTIVALLEFGIGVVVITTTSEEIDDDEEFNLTSSDPPKMQLLYESLRQ